MVIGPLSIMGHQKNMCLNTKGVIVDLMKYRLLY
jgi:hypothetical protein